MQAPAWQAVVPQLVPRQNLQGAIAANSVGINISRAVGPALGGVIIAGFGLAAPFWLNAISNIGTVGALVWWRSPQKRAGRLPAERFISAVRTGFRYPNGCGWKGSRYASGALRLRASSQPMTRRRSGMTAV